MTRAPQVVILLDDIHRVALFQQCIIYWLKMRTSDQQAWRCILNKGTEHHGKVEKSDIDSAL